MTEYKPDAIVVDLDGTLCLFDPSEREWHEYNKCGSDRVCTAVKAVIDAMASADCAIIILTGRPTMYRALTIDWLYQHKVAVDALYMRTNRDNTSNAAFKKEVYEKYIGRTYNVLFALDDNPHTVKMFRELGVSVFHVNEGR